MIYLNALDLKESTAKVTMSFHKSNLIWLDLEMTGLEPATDKILEIATVVTESDLNILAEGPVISIHQDDDLLNQMDDWNTKHHTESGLIEKVKAMRKRCLGGLL